MFVMYYHYNKYEGSGITGVFIIIFLYAGLTALNSLIFYNYLVAIHMEGRLLDVYTRVTGQTDRFFIPFDNEVSARYLRWVLHKARSENLPAREIRRHIAVTHHTVTDPAGNYSRQVLHVSIYKKRIPHS